MRLIVFVVDQEKQDVENLVVVVDGGDQAVMALDVENGHGLAAVHLNLIGRRQDPAEFDQVVEAAAGNEFLPVAQGRGSRRMAGGIVSQAFFCDDSHR